MLNNNDSSMAAKMTDRIAYLREQLRDPLVTPATVVEYIQLAHAPLPGQVQQRLDEFVTPNDLTNFTWLHNWWAPVRDKPKTLPIPTIAQFCWNANYIPGTEPITFDKAMQQFHARAIAHCMTHDLNLDSPGETAEERATRRNRERMAKVRNGRRVPDKVIKDPAVREAVRAMEEELAQLKLEAKRDDELWRDLVREHQAAMLNASDTRKKQAAQFKERIDNFRNRIRAVAAKQ